MGVAPPTVTVAIGVPTVAVEIALVGLLRGGLRVGVIDATGVGVHIGVTGSSVGGGQICSLTVN